MITLSKQHGSIINFLHSVTAKSTTLIQQHILIDRKNNELTIQGGNNDMMFEARFPCQGDDEVFFVHNKKLADIMKVSTTDIHLSVNKKDPLKGEIKAGKSKYSIALLDHKDHVTWKKLPHLSSFDIDSQSLKKIVPTLVYALADQDSRLYCNGLYFNAHDNVVDIAATDTQRIALHQMPITACQQPASFIIPKKAMHDIVKMTDNQITINVTKSYVSFAWDNMVYTTKIIDVKYPDFIRIIPQDTLTTFNIPREEFIQSLRQVSVLMDKFRGVRATFKEHTLTVEGTNNNETANHTIDMTYDADERTTAFNVDFMLDAFEALKNDNEVLWSWTPGQNAIYLRSPSQSTFKYILMPIKL